MTDRGDRTRAKILAIMKKSPSVKRPTLAWKAGTSRTNLAWHLDRLLEEGVIRPGVCSECGGEKWEVL